MKIYLVRHAKIQGNLNLVQAETDHIICDGETKQKVQKIKELFVNIDNLKVYCSKLNRAKETADLIFDKNEKIFYTALLNEYVRPSRFVGKSRVDLVRYWQEHDSDKYDPFWKPEDGESYYECALRAMKFYKMLLRDKKNKFENIVVVGHGTLFRHLVCALVGIRWQKNPRIVIDLLRQFEWGNLEVKEFDL